MRPWASRALASASIGDVTLGAGFVVLGFGAACCAARAWSWVENRAREKTRIVFRALVKSFRGQLGCKAVAKNPPGGGDSGLTFNLTSLRKDCRGRAGGVAGNQFGGDLIFAALRV